MNPRHADFQSAALPTELPDHMYQATVQRKKLLEMRGDIIRVPSNSVKHHAVFFLIAESMRHPSVTHGYLASMNTADEAEPTRASQTAQVLAAWRHGTLHHTTTTTRLDPTNAKPQKSNRKLGVK